MECPIHTARTCTINNVLRIALAGLLLSVAVKAYLTFDPRQVRLLVARSRLVSIRSERPDPPPAPAVQSYPYPAPLPTSGIEWDTFMGGGLKVVPDVEARVKRDSDTKK